MAAIDGLDRASAQRLVQQRQTLKKGFDLIASAQSLLGGKVKLSAQNVGTVSGYFLVTGQLRYEDSVLREVSLVQRRGLNVRVLWRERVPV
jgi:general secretion pathway protein K